jgi:hypothetical protein
MREYILKISVRDRNRPLAPDEMILEWGVPAANAKGFIDMLQAMTDALKDLKTPEKLAAFMRENAALTHAPIALKER